MNFKLLLAGVIIVSVSVVSAQEEKITLPSLMLFPPREPTTLKPPMT